MQTAGSQSCVTNIYIVWNYAKLIISVSGMIYMLLLFHVILGDIEKLYRR